MHTRTLDELSNRWLGRDAEQKITFSRVEFRVNVPRLSPPAIDRTTQEP